MFFIDFGRGLERLALFFLGELNLLSPVDLVNLKENISEVILKEGCKLYDLEFVGSGQNRVLRVYIELDRESSNSNGEFADPKKLESSQKLESVTIKHCASVSKKLSYFLDEKSLVSGGTYQLEVSSPGLERKLKEPWHYVLAVGKKIKVKTYREIFTEKKKAHQKVIRGVLDKVSENNIFIVNGSDVLNIDIENIDEANVILS